MILYYAMGGGLGHLTRARAVLHTLGIENDSTILTASQFAPDERVTGNIPVIRVDKQFENDPLLFKNYLKTLFTELEIETLYIDSFPFGIIGEFCDFEFGGDIEINYIARLLKWNNYSIPFQTSRIFFNKTFILEPLEKAHQKFIDESSAEKAEIILDYPVQSLSGVDETKFQRILNDVKPFWLIVHAGNYDEILELVSFAQEMREIEKAAVNLILISPDSFTFQIKHLFHFDLYPAANLFGHAARIFTACGFNAMRQTENFREKHFFIPFERRFDDQFARAKRFR